MRHVIEDIAKRQRTVWEEGHEPASLRIAQRLSIGLQAENARAVLRRMPVPGVGLVGEGGEEDEVDTEDEEMEV